MWYTFYILFRKQLYTMLFIFSDERHILMATMEAFVKEPTDDWLYFVSRQEGSHDESKVCFRKRLEAL